MIKDKIENIELYKNLSTNIGNAVRCVRQEHFLDELRVKKRIEGKGFCVLLQEYETHSDENGRWETHKEHIDIQYILAGEERTGYVNIAELGPIIESSQEKDFYFYVGPATADWVTVHSGEFVIFFPTDGHMPSLHVNDTPEDVVKVVFKVETV